MSESLQSGHHPDADLISAFAEGALPAHEREQIFDHFAGCPRCRAVVALTLPSVDESARPLPRPVRNRWVHWFSGWNLAWSTAVALTAAIFFTVYVYRAATARNVPAQMATVRPAAPTAAPVHPDAAAPDRPANLQPIGQPEGNVGGALTRPEAILAGKPTTAPLRLSGQNMVALSAPSAAPVEAREATSEFMAAKKEAPDQSLAQPAIPGAVNGDARSGATSQPRLPDAASASDRKTVVSAGVAPQLDAAAPSRAVPTQPVTTSKDQVAVETTSAAAGEVITGMQVRELPLEQSQRAAVRLPSRLPVLSLVTQERLVLAIDAHNAVFLSRDAGKRWKPVRAPWTGRAVKIVLISSGSGDEKVNGKVPPAAAGDIVTGQQVRELAVDRSMLAGTADGRLSGSVMDSQGAVVAGASVAVVNTATAAKQIVKTDAMGHYLLTGLAPGVYTIRAKAPGFKEHFQTGVTVEPNREIAENLSLALGAVTEAVTVQADEVQVETTSGAVGEIIASPNTIAKPTAKMRAKPVSSSPSAPAFEITTDNGERWTSADGATWTRR